MNTRLIMPYFLASLLDCHPNPLGDAMAPVIDFFFGKDHCKNEAEGN